MVILLTISWSQFRQDQLFFSYNARIREGPSGMIFRVHKHFVLYCTKDADHVGRSSGQFASCFSSMGQTTDQLEDQIRFVWVPSGLRSSEEVAVRLRDPTGGVVVVGRCRFAHSGVLWESSERIRKLCLGRLPSMLAISRRCQNCAACVVVVSNVLLAIFPRSFCTESFFIRGRRNPPCKIVSLQDQPFQAVC